MRLTGALRPWKQQCAGSARAPRTDGLDLCRGGYSVKTSKLQASACTMHRGVTGIYRNTRSREKLFFFEFLFLKHVIIISMTLDPRVTQVADVSFI